MKKVISVLAILSVFGLALFGWINNIVLLFNMDGPVVGETILRVVGIIIAPIGIALGYV